MHHPETHQIVFSSGNADFDVTEHIKLMEPWQTVFIKYGMCQTIKRTQSQAKALTAKVEFVTLAWNARKEWNQDIAPLSLWTHNSEISGLKEEDGTHLMLI